MPTTIEERRSHPQPIDPQTFELLMKAMDTMRSDIKADINELKVKFAEFESQHDRELVAHEKDNDHQFMSIRSDFDHKISALDKRIQALENAPALKVERTFEKLKSRIIDSLGAALGMGIVAFLIWGFIYFVAPNITTPSAPKTTITK